MTTAASATASPSFGLNPALDVPALKARFARDGRLGIADFLLAEDAERLAAHLAAREDWRLVFNSGDKMFELPRADRRAMAAADWARLSGALDEAGRYAFQYRYEAIRVPDDAAARRAADTLLDRLALFLSSNAVVAMLREITGAHDIGFADAQATCYGIGDFLTAHDDAVAGKERRAAYVLGLTRVWRPEWGGLLLFHGAAGTIDGGFVPGFNMLHLFAVPSVHSVSSVAPLAGGERLSVTGWLRHPPETGDDAAENCKTR